MDDYQPESTAMDMYLELRDNLRKVQEYLTDQRLGGNHITPESLQDIEDFLRKITKLKEY